MPCYFAFTIRGRDGNEERRERMLYIFDEPTTGLHFDDVSKLLAAFRRLIDAGGSILVIEHNLDIIKAADWIIDLGPEGGDRGGEVVIAGSPEAVAHEARSYTGSFLRPILFGSEEIAPQHTFTGELAAFGASRNGSKAVEKRTGRSSGSNDRT